MTRVTLDTQRVSHHSNGEGHEAGVYKPTSDDNILLCSFTEGFQSKVSVRSREIFTISGLKSTEVWTSIDLDSELSIMNKTVS